MIIPYNKKGSKRELFIGLFLIIVAGGWAILNPENYLTYIFLLSGILYIASFFYKKKTPYLKVENGILKKSDLFPKQIELSEVVKIKEFAGDYTIFTPSKKLKIDYVLIDESARTEFKNFLDSLGTGIEHSTKKVSSFNSH